jgi:hypothetical protein
LEAAARKTNGRYGSWCSRPGSAEVRTGRTDRFRPRNTIRQLFDSAIAGANKTCRANAVGNLSPPSTGTLLDGQQQRPSEQARQGQRELSRLMGGRVERPPHSVWPSREADAPPLATPAATTRELCCYKTSNTWALDAHWSSRLSEHSLIACPTRCSLVT